MFLRTKLLTGVLGVVLLSGVFTVISLGTLSQTQVMLEEHDRYREAKELIDGMNIQTHQISTEMLEYMATGDPIPRQRALTELSRLDNYTQRYRGLQDIPFQENVTRVNEEVERIVLETLSVYDERGRQDAVQQLSPLIHHEGEVMAFYHGEGPAYLHKREAATEEKMEVLLEIAFLQFLFGSVAALLLAGLMGVVLTRSISNPIQRLQSVIERISKGDMESSVDDVLKQRDDEIGYLAKAFDRTLVSLKLAIQKTAPRLEEEMAETRKDLATKKEQMDMMYEELPVPAVSHTPDGVIELVNARAEELLGYTEDELVGSSVDMLHPGDEAVQQVCHEVLQTVARGASVERALTFQKADGTRFTAMIHALPIKGSDGDVETVRTIITDYDEE